MLTKEKYHFIGIGGIGMSALARLIMENNGEVSGSDKVSNSILEKLSDKGAQIFLGHDSRHIKPEMTVIYSTDIKRDNPEFLAAKELNCPLLHRSQLLEIMMSKHKVLAVAGTHGKTTTSALLTWVLLQAGCSPSYAIGGLLTENGLNSSHGTGSYFVAEADESDGSFLNYKPSGAILTNIDLDHLDFYGEENALISTFEKFLSQVSSDLLFWCGDDPRLLKFNPKGQSYGKSLHCHWKLKNVQQKEWSLFFDAEFKGELFSQIEVSLIGEHNALNALAVFAMAYTLGIEPLTIRAALKSFKGVLRRCEKKGDANGILIIDDYAHHPTEIATTLKGIRNAVQERRLVVVFQPHRFTRTRDCLGQYKGIFSEADELIVTDIYGGGEPSIPGISHENILEELAKEPLLCSQYIARSELNSFLPQFLRPHDVVVTLGAGDLPKLAMELSTLFQKESPRKLKVGVIIGGRSVEHEISLLSAQNILGSLNENYYEISSFKITKEGRWISNPTFQEDSRKDLISSDVIKDVLQCDLFFPVLHGTFGEDGTIQGFFEILDRAYVGCDHASSAICMNKATTKKLMQHHQIETPPFIDFDHYEWKKHPQLILSKIIDELTFPLYVKPVHLGSSIGVKKVEEVQNLQEAIEQAFEFDYHILVENGITAREIEFAVLGNDFIRAYPPGEVCNQGSLYSYEAKYGSHAMKTLTQALLSQNLIEEGIILAEKAFKTVGCQGLARVDFFLDQNDKFWLNEINPIPGFTKNSLYPQICAEHGLSADKLMDRLIILALHRKSQRQRKIL